MASPVSARIRRAIPAAVRGSAALRLILTPEEVRLVHHVLRRDPHVPRVMIDVGAHVGSTARPFAEDGFTVHAFEPDPTNRAALLELAGRHPSMVVDPRAVSDVSGAELPFYTSADSTGASSLSAFSPAHVRAGAARTITLRDYCRAAAIGPVGLLKVDVEGFDLFVLRGADWESSRPEVVIAEFDDQKTRPLGYAMSDLARFLQERGYVVLVSEWYPIRVYGGPHRWRRLARWPMKLAAEGAVGNLIAVSRAEHLAAMEGIAARLSPLWRLVTAARRASGI